MTTITFDYVTRVKVCSILSETKGGQGGLEKLHAILSVFGKIRFDDSEMAHITRQDLPDGRATYAVKTEDIQTLSKAVELETAEVLWLQRTLEEWEEFATIADVEWYDALMTALKTQTPQRTSMPSHQFKRRK